MPLGHAIGDAAAYLASGVLIAFGLYNLLGSENDERIQALAEPCRLRALGLGISVGFDELAIGFTLDCCAYPSSLWWH